MVPPRFPRLVIYGVGLLGGSLGMAVRRRAMAGRIVGLGRSLERLERARHLGAIDECHTTPQAALEGADALVLALPPRQIRERLADLAELVPAGAFVTDVGSVKARIVARAEEVLPEHLLFIGSHPMAGSEKSGADHGRSDFYEDHACILTPTERTRPEALELARRFWTALGARVVEIAPERHDQLLAGISHLPHLMAAALLQSLARDFAPPAELARIAGGGLRDLTRIAAADTETWKQIFSENAPAMLAGLDSLEQTLNQWRAALQPASPDLKTLGKLWEEGRETRRQLDGDRAESKD